MSGQVGSARGQWQGEAYVQQLRTGKSGTVDIDAIAQEPSQLRLEATGSFGVHLASIALNGDTVQFILSREKKFVQSTATSSSLARVLPVRLSALDLMRILFDRELDPHFWDCNLKNGLLFACKKRDGSVSIHWERTPEYRSLTFSSNEAEVELHLREAKSKVEFSLDAFTLKPPNGFTKETL